MTSRLVRRFAVVAVASLTSAGLGGVVSPAMAKSDPLVDAFVKGFVGSFEKAAGTKIPTTEAKCIGEKFLAKVKLSEVVKNVGKGDLSPAQKTVLVDAFGNCLSGTTYKAVLHHNLASKFTQAQITCVGDKAVVQVGVPALIALDFKATTGNTKTGATETALVTILKGCVKA